MDSTENINLKAFKLFSLILFLIGLCLYFTSTSSPAGAVRSYFFVGFTLLFLIFGISFSDYTYVNYKKYFSDCALKYIVYAAAYTFICSVIILFTVFTVRNNLRFLTNVTAAINNTKFVFTNFWFIPAYLTVLLILPFLNYILKKTNYSPVLFASIVLVIISNEIITPILSNNGFPLRDIFASMRYVLFYGLFTLIGLSYKKLEEGRQRYKIVTVFFIFTCIVLITACVLIYGYSYDLIKQFYPPTFFLTVYHLLILAVLYISLPKLKKIANFTDNKKFTNFVSDYLMEILFISPLILYLLSLCFSALKFTGFFNEYFIIGFLAYFLSSFLILTTTYLISALIQKKTQKSLLL